MCGEQVASATVHGLVEGSSPRVRGTDGGGLIYDAGQGIIPACAGNRPEWHPHEEYLGDHPRVCGEQDICDPTHIKYKGSSPRVRGTVEPGTWTNEDMGIIPACAGNRDQQQYLETLPRDHPRVCGEQLIKE